MTNIEVKNLVKYFGQDENEVFTVDDVSFKVAQGEFICIMGPSGGGKSTILRIIAGLEKYDNGKITGMPKEKGFVFQNFALFPWMSVKDNIGFGLKMMGLSKEQIDQRVEELIKKMGLEGFEKAHPKELSGGMRQRVGIARALAINPEVLMLDEPFSSLDEIIALRLREELLKIWEETHKTVIMVTHSAEEAAFLADKVIILSKRLARIVGIVENSLARPRNVRSKQFFRLVDKISDLL
ncbi:MAG: ABC transporter ATP-binding protein [bacterium]|nr:ABC transporter ATP-binding protein [bacterium]